MSTITTRSGKGSPLTHNEVDANFTNLNTDKYQSGDNVTLGTATVTTFTSTGIDDNATSTAITIDASENVGIGIVSPSHRLNVFSGAEDIARFQGAGSYNLDLSNPGNTRFDFKIGSSAGAFSFTNSSSELMRISSAGNVGIGTASPSMLLGTGLHIDSTGYTSIVLQKGGAGQGHNIDFTDASNALQYRIGTNFASGGENLLFAYGSTPTIGMTLNSSGDLSVGSVSNHAGARVVINDTPPTAFGSPMFQVGQETFTSSGVYSIGFGYTAGSYTEPPAEIAAVSTSSSGGTTADIIFGTRSVTTNTAVTERMRISSAGNVGIGSTAPTSDGAAIADNLVVKSTGSAGITITSPDANNATLNFGSASDNDYFGIQGFYNSGSPFGRFSTGGTERMRIDGNGQTMIQGSTAGFDTTAAQNGLQLYYETDTGLATLGSYSSGGSTSMTFHTNSGGGASAEAMRIDSAGNVGIGNTIFTSPRVNAPHLVVGDATNSPGLTLLGGAGDQASINFADATSGTGGYDGGFVYGFGSGTPYMTFHVNGGTERMRIDSSGNLLVGKPATGLNTAGTEFTTTGQVYATSSNVIAGYFNRQGATGTTNLVGFRVANSDAGTIQSSAGGTPAFAAASDERLKENITDHESELSNVMALRPVRWDWKDKNSGAGEGFVAQELEQTAWADLVSEGEDGYKMVSGLGAVETRLIKALQEQQVMIEELKAEVAALKGE